jgi:hypothetical protein
VFEHEACAAVAEEIRRMWKRLCAMPGAAA